MIFILALIAYEGVNGYKDNKVELVTIFSSIGLFYLEVKSKFIMKKKYDDSIYNKVCEFRVLKRMSQQELTDTVGVSKEDDRYIFKRTYFRFKDSPLTWSCETNHV